MTVHRRVIRGHPAEVLLHHAKDADLLVVGSHGHGGFVGAPPDSVSHRCIQRVTCPVVVVRAGRLSGVRRTALDLPAERAL